MKFALLGLLGNIAIFLLFAFANWEINPKYWDVFLRGMFSFLLIVVAFFCAAGVNYEIKD